MPNQLRTKSPLDSALNSILSLNRLFPTPSSLFMTTRKDGNWPDLEAALFQWQLATNRQNNTLTLREDSGQSRPGRAVLRISLRVTRSLKRRSLTMIWTRLSQFGLPRLLLPY